MKLDTDTLIIRCYGIVVLVYVVVALALVLSQVFCQVKP